MTLARYESRRSAATRLALWSATGTSAADRVRPDLQGDHPRGGATPRAHDAAKKQLRVFRDRFAAQFPEAVACLDRGFAAGTAYYAFPEAHWVRIRTTNGLERLHGEIKRRTRATGAFPDRPSALRLITAVALHSTNIWRDRLYLDMSVLNDHAAALAA